MTSLQCVEAFSPAQPREEQNHEEYGLQSGQYLQSWDGVVTKEVGLSLRFRMIELLQGCNSYLTGKYTVSEINVHLMQ